MTQLSIADIRNPGCPHGDFIDDNDNHCDNHGMAPRGYAPLGEDSEDHDDQMAAVNGPYLDDVKAIPQALPTLPAYIPVIPSHSGKLMTSYTPEWVGVQLGRIVSGTKLNIAPDIHKRLGIRPGVKVVLLAYGLDALIENIWPERRRVLKEIAGLGFDLATAINYSIWDMHPHPEKILNVKRSLVTYQELQEFGVPAIPHIYWYGEKSMRLWANWLHQNDCVGTVAIDAQTLKQPDWERFIRELEQFVQLVGRQLHYLVTGPAVAERIQQLRNVLSSVTLTNTFSAMKAWKHRKLELVGGNIVDQRLDDEVGTIFPQNVGLYQHLMTV